MLSYTIFAELSTFNCGRTGDKGVDKKSGYMGVLTLNVNILEVIVNNGKIVIDRKK